MNHYPVPLGTTYGKGFVTRTNSWGPNYYEFNLDYVLPENSCVTTKTFTKAMAEIGTMTAAIENSGGKILAVEPGDMNTFNLKTNTNHGSMGHTLLYGVSKSDAESLKNSFVGISVPEDVFEIVTEPEKFAITFLEPCGNHKSK